MLPPPHPHSLPLAPPWSPPETKDSAIDSPDAQRQEWFAQYFSFWSTTNRQTQRLSMTTKCLLKKTGKKISDVKKKKKGWKKCLKLFLLYCHSRFGCSVHFRSSQFQRKKKKETEFWWAEIYFWDLFLTVGGKRLHRTLMSLLFTLVNNAFMVRSMLLTEENLNWTRTVAIKCHHHSDLIWLFDSLWLFHCGWVCLLVQWQWSSSRCLMFI